MVMLDNKDKNYSILVADDSSSARAMIAGRLTKLGYKVHQAVDGKEAYQKFLQEDPCLILMDANMPVVDGFRACSEVKRNPKGLDTRVIMVTGQGDDASVERAFNAGAEEYITKPIHWAVLEQRISLMIERSRDQAVIRESNARMAAIFNAAVDGILVINSDGVIENLNQSAARIFGFWEWELEGKNITMLMPSEVGRQNGGYLQGYVQTKEEKIAGKRNEVVGVRKDGSHFPLELSVSEVKLENRFLFTGIVRDITRRKETEKKIYHQANYDALTNLPNRSLFLKNIAKQLQVAKKADSKLALIFIDLDRFKWINDNLGHVAGDTLLRVASQRIKDLVAAADAVARLGGDEFTAVITNFKLPSEIEAISFAILKALNEPFQLEGEEVFISGSLGVAIFPQDGDDLTLLLKRSDEAMYRSKNAGRNAYHFYGGESLILEKKY